jgi:hypothetical protein
MNPRNQCTVPESLSHKCSANRTGRSRVISCLAITIRIMDEVMCSNMTWKFTPSVLIKVDKVAVCGSGG